MNAARRAISALGELLVTAGVIVLLFGAYELWGTGLYTAAQQDNLRAALNQSWAAASAGATPTQGPSPSPGTSTTAPVKAPAFDITQVPIGSGLAVLRIPRFGADYQKVIVQGVGVEDLKRGPGHYPGSAFPGDIGNFVVSGHRTTYGAPFNRIDELKPGDPIVVQTATDWFVYRVTSSEVVPPTATDVINPVPHHGNEQPTKALLTLTTCNPKYSASQRLIVYAELDQRRPVADGPPDVLAKG
ncbi:MAG: sortase [Frankiaceae bacterium]|jgi:sortase A|nr:sortase [Frankiaceae bacterium]MDQ1714210.1 sortase [Frankiaceae bacterium]